MLAAIAAVLRVVGLDAKGFWEDEAATVALLRIDHLGDLLTAIADTERVPPLYYLLAWPWSRIFGDSEVGLRSLSVLIGVATVPVAYLAARELVSQRAGIIAAALVAVNPLLVWYSQEARGYGLLVLLSGLALYFLARSLGDPSPRSLALWSLSSVLALATHYFAAFLFLGEAAWLIGRLGARRAVLVATAVPAAAAIALIPLAVAQQDAHAGSDWIPNISLLTRVVEIPGYLLVGFELPFPLALGLAALAAVLAGVGLLLLLTRGDPGERHGALVAGSVAVAGLALPLALVVVGVDAFIYRNVIGVLLPLAIVVAAGLGAARAGRIGIATAAGLAAVSVGVVLATASEPKYQREAWREAAAALGPAERARAIVTTPGEPGREPLQNVYLPDTALIGSGSVRVSEVDVLALPRREFGKIETAELPDVDEPPASPGTGFRLVEQRSEDHFLLYRYRSSRPRELSYDAIVSAALDPGVTPLVLLEPPEVP